MLHRICLWMLVRARIYKCLKEEKKKCFILCNAFASRFALYCWPFRILCSYLCIARCWFLFLFCCSLHSSFHCRHHRRVVSSSLAFLNVLCACEKVWKSIDYTKNNQAKIQNWLGETRLAESVFLHFISVSHLILSGHFTIVHFILLLVCIVKYKNKWEEKTSQE